MTTAAQGETDAPVPQEAFPIDTLPNSVYQFVSCHARALPVAPDLLALTVLTTLGAAIGNTRRIRLWDGWEEPALIYGAIVADSGGMKSPALKKATHPYVTLKFDCRRTWTTDTTTEQLGILLDQNPHGIYFIKDELTSLVKSLDQYKQGGKGSDRQFYLSAWDCTPTAVDRVARDAIMVDNPYLSVIGNIPPDLLPELIKQSNHGDGFIQRFLFAWPKSVPAYRTGVTVPEEVKEDYQRLIVRLLTLKWPGTPKPVVLRLTPEAEACFTTWHDAHITRMEAQRPLLKQFDSKLKAYCGRLALIHAMASNPDAGEVGAESIQAGILLTRYFRAQAHRVVAALGVDVDVSRVGKEETLRLKILKAMNNGPQHKKRDVQRSISCAAEVFNGVWDSMLRPELMHIGEGHYTLSTIDNRQDHAAKREPRPDPPAPA